MFGAYVRIKEEKPVHFQMMLQYYSLQTWRIGCRSADGRAVCRSSDQRGALADCGQDSLAWQTTWALSPPGKPRGYCKVLLVRIIFTVCDMWHPVICKFRRIVTRVKVIDRLVPSPSQTRMNKKGGRRRLLHPLTFKCAANPVRSNRLRAF